MAKKIVLLLALAPCINALAGPGLFAGAMQLRLRGGGMEQLAGDAVPGPKVSPTERDPTKRKELFNSVPRINHKEEWQKWKSERMPKKSRGPIWRELTDFACGAVVSVSPPCSSLQSHAQRLLAGTAPTRSRPRAFAKDTHALHSPVCFSVEPVTAPKSTSKHVLALGRSESTQNFQILRPLLPRVLPAPSKPVGRACVNHYVQAQWVVLT